jgi:6-phosphogluconolactonase (cycloisomerase 2 family)
MNMILRLAVLSGAVAATTALFAAPAGAAPRSADPGRHGGAVFVESDNLSANTVVAYSRAADGTLTQDGVYPTGGQGGQLTGSVVDHTASQGALAFDAQHNLLYAVNAGSDTITEFAVHGDQLSRLQTVWSGGSFPVSLTVHDGLLYVLNARGGGSIQGYARFGTYLVRVPFWHRDLGFNPNATPEFTSTPGQVAFTPDGSDLVVTTKGDGQSIEVFRVGVFGPSARPVITADPGNVPFAIAFDRQGHLAIAEAGPSAVATFRINRDGTLDLIDRATTGQAATCWLTATGRHLYASNAGSASVTTFDSHDGTVTALGNTTTDAGTVDSAASPDGQFLYVQTGAAGIVDEFGIRSDGSLQSLGSVTVPGGAGGEGIVAS